ncbi:ABC transporter permease [Pseudomonas alabamensis]|uniref:ABC transporter permease n=1 Tax=Pseudomonas alabamensis TaxID=3064349 RepID=UPI003F653D29
MNGSMSLLRRLGSLSLILLKEQLKEPTALLWSIVSPCAFYLMLQSASTTDDLSFDAYLPRAAWFLAYLSATTAFFGMSFYLVGRRESGFVRSFIYTRRTILLFLSAHITTHLVVSLFYATVFYGITRWVFGLPAWHEYVQLMSAYFVSYLAFASAGLLVSLLPLTFSGANTLFSILSFAMLTSGYVGAQQVGSTTSAGLTYNPLTFCTRLFMEPIDPYAVAGVLLLFGACACATAFLFRVQPVWSRYA